MKRILPLCMAALLVSLPISFATAGTSYEVVSLGAGEYPVVAATGDAAWLNAGEVFYRSAATGLTTRLTNDTLLDNYLVINAVGQATWLKQGGWVYYYSPSTGVLLLNDNSPSGNDPRITSSGEVIFPAHTGNGFYHWTLAGGTSRLIDAPQFDNSFAPPFDVSDAGAVGWTSFGLLGGTTGKLVASYWDPSTGTTTELLRSPYLGNLAEPAVNNRGEMVWPHDTGASWEVMHWSKGTGAVTQITNNAFLDAWPVTNDRGDISWMSADEPDGNFIYYRSGATGATSRLAVSNFINYPGPRMNRHGQVAFSDFQAFVWTPDTGRLLQVSQSSTAVERVRISDTGHLVWASNDSVFLALARDDDPPVITPIITGTQGRNGWYTSAVTVAWNVIDNESPVTSSSGCDATTLTAETSGQSVTCSATSAGGTSSNTVTVKIDTTPPTMSCTVTPNVLSPPNHKLVNIAATLKGTDALSGSSGFTLVSVTSNEPDAGLGNGDVPNDTQGWAVGTADVTGQLRAERSDAGTGRIYTLSYRSVDLAGNIGRCNTTVAVPRNQKK